jgi:uncharacterized membrane protein YbaN (DUF454 family)
VRAGWLAGGWVAVAIGGIGIVVPGLPTTVFFIIAASCFGRSSPRFEQWVLGLPRIGRMVADHRAGLGMPGRAKVAALITMWAAIVLSAVALRERRAVVGSGRSARRHRHRLHPVAGSDARLTREWCG